MIIIELYIVLSNQFYFHKILYNLYSYFHCYFGDYLTLDSFQADKVWENFVDKIDCGLNWSLVEDIFYNFAIEFDEKILNWAQIVRLKNKAQVEGKMLEVWIDIEIYIWVTNLDLFNKFNNECFIIFWRNIIFYHFTFHTFNLVIYN